MSGAACEGGAFFTYGARWLRADNTATVFAIDGVADRLHLDDVTLLTPVEDALTTPPPGYRLADSRTLDMPGDDLALRRYVR